MKLSTIAVLAALGLMTFACSSEEPTPEDTGAVREAICTGGGGGGDACSSGTGYCPPECSYCFQSTSHRIALQNMWECTADPGGGGGGGAGICGPNGSYTATFHSSISETEACTQAGINARDACRNSGWICTGYPISTTSAGGCDVGSGDASCSCTATVTCGYR